MKKVFLNRALRVLLISNSFVLLAGAMLGPIYAIFVERVGGDLLDASIAGGLFALAAGITTILAGKYADKIKESELIIVFGYILMGFGFLLYTVVSSILFLFVVQVIIGFAEAVYAPAFDALYSKHIDRGKAGREWGAWESMNYFSVAIGAVIGGLIVNSLGFNVIFIIMALLCFVSGFYIYFLPRKLL